MANPLFKNAAEILERNDLGTYTVPTHGLYPFQWNWDSCLTALGQAYFDEARAWTEIETLFAHQWDDGMVPHIIFHKEDEGYFPGPEVWNTGRKVPTSGITQPPVAGFAVRRLFERAKQKDLARAKARELIRKIHKWHEWFFRCRDPHGTGLVAVLHPWETGRDNSIDWDDPFKRVPSEGVHPFTRRDTLHANPEHRPTKEQYDRYIYLVQHFRSLGWDNSILHDQSPFCIVDPGFNAILFRGCADVAILADLLGETEIAQTSKAWTRKGAAALESLWSSEVGQYLCYDRKMGQLINSASVGGILPLFADIPLDRKKSLADRIADLSKVCEFLVPSHDPTAAEFDGMRYWRGPCWLIVNYLISDGLLRSGLNEIAHKIQKDSLRLIEKSGFAEYYDPITGTPCGGGQFTWTAAMVIELLSTHANDESPLRNRE